MWDKQYFAELYKLPSRNGLSVPVAERGEGVSLLGMGDLFASGRIRFERDMERVPLAPENRAIWLVRFNDLLFGRRSLVLAGAGKCVIVKEQSEPLTFESSLIRVRLDESLAWPDFYYYFFLSRAGQDVMSTIVEQVAVAGIRSSDLGRIKVPVPPIEEQRRIAGVLGKLDDLIDVNEQNSERLRELHASLFAAAQASAEGVVTLADIAVLNRKRSGGDAETPYLGLEHFAMDAKGIVGVGRLGDTKSQQQEFARGDVLYGRLRPYFRKVDRAAFSGACTGEIWVLEPKSGYASSFLYAVVSTQDFTDFAMSGSEGTKMPRAKWDHVASYEVARPSGPVFDEICVAAETLWEQRAALSDENAQLRRTRDELLPLLMSGKVRVGETA